jgi:YVTN family beta-propeller protein
MEIEVAEIKLRDALDFGARVALLSAPKGEESLRTMNSTTMKKYFCGRKGMRVILGLLFAAVPLAAGTAHVYVTNRGGTTIDVIDTATNKVVQTIKGIESPEVVRFSPDGSRLYIATRSEDVLDVMDRKSGKIFKKVPLSGWANDAGVTSDGKLIVVAIRNTGTEALDAGALDIIDSKTLEKVKSIPVKRGLHDVSLTGDGKFAAAGSPGGHFITVFDLQKMEIAWELPYDQGILPLIIQSNPDGSGHRIFAQMNQTNGFSVVDFATHKEITRIKNPDEPNGFTPGCEGISHGIGISPDNKTLWTNSRPANAVFVYSLPDLKLMGHVSLPETPVPGKAPRGGGPAWITFTPDSRTVYISTCGTKSITAIDVEAMKEITQIPVHEMPDRISTLVLP